MIPPGSWLGVLGGGASASMLVRAAQRMGFRVAVLGADAHSTAGAVADRWVHGDYRDEDVLADIAASCAGIVVMLDDFPPNLARLAGRCPLVPAPAVVASCGDRARWSVLVERCGVEAAQPGDGGPQRREISVIVARRESGEVACYPAVEVRRIAGRIEAVIAPARASRDVAARAAAAAERIAGEIGLVGVLCVELDLLPKEMMTVRALVPQPHVCGYHTTEACATSQFEQQVRVLAGLPLGPATQHSPAVIAMLADEPLQAAMPGLVDPVQRRGVTLHLYGPADARCGNAIGHCTVVSPHIETALDTARAIRAELAH